MNVKLRAVSKLSTFFIHSVINTDVKVSDEKFKIDTF
jgi:hypothetical protein